MQALTCYRNALRLDGRHYNAMYGIGQIHFRQVSFAGAQLFAPHPGSICHPQAQRTVKACRLCLTVMVLVGL